MKNNYMYAVNRSDEYLAHYGVRGMKWGVRKAIERGDRQALSKHYQKAAKKLAKLSLNANQDVQKRLYNSAKSRMVQGSLGSALGSAGLTAAMGGSLRSAGAAGAAGLIGGALLNSRGIMAGRHASDKGHARAIKKRNEFRREMESTFKNTGIAPNMKEMQKFHNQITALSNQSDPRRYVNKQYGKALREVNHQIKRNENVSNTLKNGLKSAGVAALAGPGAAMYYDTVKAEKRRDSLSQKRKKAQDDANRLTAAEAVRDKSLLGRHGFGKTQRAVTEARNAARQSYSDYYNSMTDKQKKRHRNRYAG